MRSVAGAASVVDTAMRDWLAYARSTRCGTMTNQTYIPALRLRALTRFYDPVAALASREREFKRRLIDQLAPEPGQRTLDLGCGTGTLAIAIKERQPEASVAGLVADPEMLGRAASKAEAAGVEIELTQAMADSMPFADASFDAVVSTLFFHHVAPAVKVAVLGEVLRVLIPGGKLHIADWGRPGDPLMAVAGLGIRVLDGFDVTADNFAGRLPDLIAEAGFVGAEVRDAMRTPFGLMTFYSASTP